MVDLRSPETDVYSRSSLEYNAFLELLISDDNGNDENDEDTYIEIALEPGQVASTQPQEKNDEQEQELELRISFSRVLPFPGFSSSPGIMRSSMETISRRADAKRTSNLCPQVATSKPTYIQRTRRPRIRFPSVNRLLRIFASTLNSSQQEARHSQHPQMIDDISWDLVGSRKQSITTATARTNESVISLLVKLRAKTFGKMLSSLLKLRQLTSPPENNRQDGRIHDQVAPQRNRRLLMKPFRKNFLQHNHKGSSKTRIIRPARIIDTTKLDGNTEALTLDGLSTKTSARKLAKETKSCPHSLKSSPNYQQKSQYYARDNSVQAAIAHCKKSFGQAHDFVS